MSNSPKFNTSVSKDYEIKKLQNIFRTKNCPRHNGKEIKKICQDISCLTLIADAFLCKDCHEEHQLRYQNHKYITFKSNLAGKMNTRLDNHLKNNEIKLNHILNSIENRYKEFEIYLLAKINESMKIFQEQIQNKWSQSHNLAETIDEIKQIILNTQELNKSQTITSDGTSSDGISKKLSIYSTPLLIVANVKDTSNQLIRPFSPKIYLNSSNKTLIQQINRSSSSSSRNTSPIRMIENNIKSIPQMIRYESKKIQKSLIKSQSSKHLETDQRPITAQQILSPPRPLSGIKTSQELSIQPNMINILTPKQFLSTMPQENEFSPIYKQSSSIKLQDFLSNKQILSEVKNTHSNKQNLVLNSNSNDFLSPKSSPFQTNFSSTISPIKVLMNAKSIEFDPKNSIISERTNSIYESHNFSKIDQLLKDMFEEQKKEFNHNLNAFLSEILRNIESHDNDDLTLNKKNRLTISSNSFLMNVI